MAQDHIGALGQIVKELRKAKGLNQNELGTRAGYGAGAGVAISRLENGLLKPGVRKLQAIAQVLDLTLEELEARASTQSGENSLPTKTIASDERDRESPQARAARIQQEIFARKNSITSLSEKFGIAQDRARDEFFMRFIEVAERIEGAQKPDTIRPQIHNASGADADNLADRQLEDTSDGFAQLLAVGGGVATNLAISWLSGGARATKGLTGVVAAPLFALAAGGLVMMIKRNRQQQRELAAQLDVAEAQLNATEPGFKAVRKLLPRATETLEYIAVHAGHAVNRWENQLGAGTMSWEQLGKEGRQRYGDFIAISAAQISLLQIDVQRLLTTHDREELHELIADAENWLSVSRDAVEARV
ncbi:transcriptional regulator with XRE-family HTH domain [Cryobacterium mesophilum]|uniref:XRE family transcriptional regulator n=1 Tax=Terrimesophilobacter mesophilus TaxID=433647 RepID=A0A4R8VCG3_9MICO|nr:helix-turn-helix transcriptional regulator [Terrimesophilobacter mesophilus]MBB5633415.1 transcriptional regulator with XRE-family HTH domain [Terrimesophilobacter mesophilus]TFB80136.1 XRE family transcriptional regulator [Terrimesophilobacter mesophilus]